MSWMSDGFISAENVNKYGHWTSSPAEPWWAWVSTGDGVGGWVSWALAEGEPTPTCQPLPVWPWPPGPGQRAAPFSIVITIPPHLLPRKLQLYSNRGWWSGQKLETNPFQISYFAFLSPIRQCWICNVCDWGTFFNIAVSYQHCWLSAPDTWVGSQEWVVGEGRRRRMGTWAGGDASNSIAKYLASVLPALYFCFRICSFSNKDHTCDCQKKHRFWESSPPTMVNFWAVWIVEWSMVFVSGFQC